MEDYFTSVPSINSSDANANNAAQLSGGQNIGNINTISVGFGTQVLRSDKSGLWLGGATFASAPFSVDMNGNVTATTLNALTKTGVGQNLTGSIQAGNGNVLMDGANKRFIVNDGTNDRCLLGYLAGAF